MENRVFCPIEECGRAFFNQSDLEKHLERRHAEIDNFREFQERVENLPAKPRSATTAESDLAAEIGVKTTQLAVNELLSSDFLLEISGQDSLEDITDLILRDKNLTVFQSNQELELDSLISLEFLSLSNNQIRHIQGVSQILGLLELNINCNMIVDLSPLSSLSILKKLFCSNNQIKTILPIKPLKHLSEFSIYNNKLFDLTSTIKILVQLPNLKILDIERNPCILSTPNARYQILSSIKLEELDGQKITSADMELTHSLFQSAPLVPKNFIGRLRTTTALYAASERDLLLEQLTQTQQELRMVQEERDLLKRKLASSSENPEILKEENARLKREVASMFVLLDELNQLREKFASGLGTASQEIYEQNARLRARIMQLEQNPVQRPGTARPRPATAKPAGDIQEELRRNQAMIEALESKVKAFKSDLKTKKQDNQFSFELRERFKKRR